MQVALAEFAKLALQVGLRLLEDAVNERLIDRYKRTLGQLRSLGSLNFSSGCLIDPGSGFDHLI